MLVAVAAAAGAGCAESSPAARGPARGPMLPPETGDLGHLCGEARPCHPATRIRLMRDDGSAFEADVPPAPFILGQDIVRVLPGDDFSFAGEEHDGAIVGLRYLAAPPADQKNVIRVRLEQSIVSGHHVMLLHVQSSFDKPVIYHANVHGAGWVPGRFLKTSTCPLSPGVTSMEMWPQPISAIMLLDFRVSPDARACSYY